ncbi:hypothetical protein [Bradyrhizobium sp. SZCCHNRI2009]|uniref:hypothetical protein n=1 Tax=Bradyrhizobium sp. SZCCHNRI2009 TaxID=3057282 RepID=UPI002916F650|nr:hypothetical protein [Bradyrhizobium sp. SZCCHNRI2009]
MEVTRAALAASSSRAQRRDPVLPTCIVDAGAPDGSIANRTAAGIALHRRGRGQDRTPGPHGRFRLDVRDIGHWQREGIRFEVVDDESQLLSLQCADFEFLLIGYAEGTIN